MAKKLINVTHPKVSIPADKGGTETLELGQQEVEAKIADKLIARGLAKEVAEVKMTRAKSK